MAWTGLIGEMLAHHVKEQRVDIKVRLLLSITDDTGLCHAASTLHLKAGRCHAGQLEALQVPDSPCQDLKRGATERRVKEKGRKESDRGEWQGTVGSRRFQ